MSLDTEPRGGSNLEWEAIAFDPDILRDDCPFPTQYPIPIENRLYYVNDNDLPDYYPSVEDIAEELGVEVEWVVRTAHDLGVEEADVAGEYMQYALPVLRQEHDWQQIYLAEDDLVSRYRMGQILEMPDTWVEKTLGDLQYEPFRTIEDPVIIHQYEKTILQHLRAVKMSIRPDGDKVTIYELHAKTGRSWGYIKKFLETNGYLPENRRARRSGKYCPHYDASAETKILAEVPDEREARWYTKRDIRAIVGRGGKWVDDNIAPYASIAKVMADRSNRSREHYPEEVVTVLVGLSLAPERQTPAMTEDHVSLNEMSNLAGRERGTIMRILDFMGEPAEMRLNEQKRAVLSCRRDLLEDIKSFDTALLQDKAALALQVSKDRGLVLSLQKQISAITKEMRNLRAKGGTHALASLAILDSSRDKLRTQKNNADNILKRSSRRYEQHLEAMRVYRESHKLSSNAT